MLAIIDSTAAEFRLAGLLLVLLLACLAGLAFVLWVRKWVKDETPAARQEVGFTLSDLRALHKSGKMSDEEFERAREKIVAHARRNMPAARSPPGERGRLASGSARSSHRVGRPDGGETAG